MSNFKQISVPNDGARRKITGPFRLADLPDAGEYKNEFVHVVDTGLNATYVSDGARWGPLNGSVILARSAVAVSCPADTNENVLAVIPVPPNAMGLNGVLRIRTLWSLTNSANNKTLRIRFSGATGTIFGTSTLGTGVLTAHGLVIIANRGAVNSQIGIRATFTSPYSASGSPNITAAVDTSADTTIVITGEKTVGGETLTLESYLAELLAP
jgi:hypothetical protein